jgi:hypothetical protein
LIARGVLPSLKVDHTLTVQLYSTSAILGKLGAEPKLKSDGSLAAIRRGGPVDSASKPRGLCGRYFAGSRTPRGKRRVRAPPGKAWISTDRIDRGDHYREKAPQTAHSQAVDPQTVLMGAVGNLPSAGDNQQRY